MNSFTALLLVLTALLCPIQLWAQQGVDDTLSQLAPQSFDRPINPDLYLIRPGERLVVTPLKVGMAASELVVGPEGRIVDSRIGVIDVNGLTLTDVRKKLAGSLAGQYRSAQIDVSVSGPRLVSITVTGAVAHPGTYQLWTSQSVVDAITRAGGLLASASTRRVQFSGGPTAITVDLDRLKYARDLSADTRLYGGTTVTAPLRSVQSIKVLGEVLNPREIELVDGDTYESVIALAGGALPTGDASSPKHVVDNYFGRLNKTDLRDGDILRVPFSTGTLSSRGVIVSGAVSHPGGYSFSNAKTFADALAAAGGALPSAVIGRSVIIRRNPRLEPGSDTVPSVPIWNLCDESGKPKPIALAPLDSIYVPASIGIVKVTGQILRPGVFPFAKGRTVADYVAGAGGYGVANSRISVSVRNRTTGQILLAAPESIVEDGDEVLISLTDGRL